FLDLQLAQRKVQAEQRHAAADVVPDQLRMQTIREERDAGRSVFARMEIRKGCDFARPGETCHLVELPQCGALDPGSIGEIATNLRRTRRRMGASAPKRSAH